jgi:SagB-type dehydrogenase family enzyme
MQETLHIKVLPEQEGSVTIADALVTVYTFRRKLSLSNPGEPLRHACQRLLVEHDSMQDVINDLAIHGAEAVQQLYGLLQRMYHDGSVQLTYVRDGIAMARFTSMHAMPLIVDVQPVPTTFHMARFAMLHRGTEYLTLEAPLASARMELLDHNVASEITVMMSQSSDIHSESILARLLVRTGLAHAVDGHGMSEERSMPELDGWSIYEMYFQFRSRYGFTSYPNGAYWLAAGRRTPPPADRPNEADAITVALPVPDAIPSQPLESTIAARVSTRTFQQRPMSLQQLGTLFWRTMRQTGRFTMALQGSGGTEIPFELKQRPVPSGGSIHEVDAYLLTTLDGDLSPGLWRYDDVGHAMIRVADVSEDSQTILFRAQVSAGLSAPHHTLILFSARFDRMMWKYTGMPMAAIMKHVGVLYEVMYLVATDMGLGVCALGSGDTLAFARLTDMHPAIESSVGEMLLGIPEIS